MCAKGGPAESADREPASRGRRSSPGTLAMTVAPAVSDRAGRRRMLLDRDGGAGALQGCLGLLRGLLVRPLQDRLWGAVDQVLGLLEAQAGERANLLYDLGLL